MEEHFSVTNGSQEVKKGVMKRYFDGIKFLWQTAETRYLLILTTILFGSMIASFVILFLIRTYEETNLLIRLTVYVQPFFYALLGLILIELTIFYQNGKKLLVDRSKDKKGFRRIVLIIIFGALLVITAFTEFALGDVYFLLASIVSFGLLGFTILLFVLLFVTGFITARGTMNSFQVQYSKRFQQQRNLFYISVLIPWIFFLGFFVGIQILGDIYVLLAFVSFAALLIFGFLGLVGVISFLKLDYWTGYGVSSISSFLAFLFILLIPSLIGIVYDVLAPIVSFIVLSFFFIQGTLNSLGNDLREYFKSSDETHIPTKVPNVYRNFVIGFTLFLLTFFAIILTIGVEFPIWGAAKGIEYLGWYLIATNLEIDGITAGIIISTISIVFLRARKQKKAIMPPTQQQIFCSVCGAPNKPESTFCVNCGKQL
ncbi:MAG: zinc ribbon domain-containing protein [Promethearchaeota archaeon]